MNSLNNRGIATPAAVLPDLGPPAHRPDPPAAIEVHLIGPSGAKVYRDDTLLAVLPGRFAMPRGDTPVTLRISAPGHADLEIPLTPDGDIERTITLLRSPGATTHKKKRPATTAHNVEDLEF
ncbi:MAG: hypothetical protein JKY37_06660 [Nannocystaceae bacterium]|nr:hypothetical protein [Nannocystaceae bacterium]